MLPERGTPEAQQRETQRQRDEREAQRQRDEREAAERRERDQKLAQEREQQERDRRVADEQRAQKNAAAERCQRMGMEIMAASNNAHCNMNAKTFPSLGARRDAERDCYAEIDTRVAPMKARYKDQCGSSGGGASRQ